MARLPIIGITTYSRNQAGEFCLPGAYVDAVQSAGGLPLLIPHSQTDVAQLLGAIDGLIFSGGGDINPALYGSPEHSTLYMVDAERDQCELTLAKLALANAIPTLGICRGMQLLNVASGGTLVAHVPDLYGKSVDHRLEQPRGPLEHAVQIDSVTRLAEILKTTEVNVMSWHHQAVQTVPNCWQAVAWASDGLVEAIEHKQHPWLIAVQWHPEMSPPDSPHEQLFQSLVKAAGAETVLQKNGRI
jgi:putative glutamine amidotransferase